MGKRQAVGKMLQETSISERRACALVGLARDSWRCPPKRAHADREMSQKIVELAHERRRFGYRRIGDLIEPRARRSMTSGSTGCTGWRTWRLAPAVMASGAVSVLCRDHLRLSNI